MRTEDCTTVQYSTLDGDLALSPEDVGVVQLVEQLHLLEHVVPVRAVLVHLQHHDLARRLVGNLKARQEREEL